MSETCLYSAYDRDGRFLYVGISGNWGIRWAQHSERSEFFRAVARLDIEFYPDRESAAIREAEVIRESRPAYNIRSGAIPNPARSRIADARRRRAEEQFKRAHEVDSGRGAFIGTVHAHCEESGCSVRSVEFLVKEFDGPTPSRLLCPACRHPLNVHRVRTRNEEHEERDRVARASVNRQLYEASGDPFAFAIPFDVLLNDRLPALR